MFICAKCGTEAPLSATCSSCGDRMTPSRVAVLEEFYLRAAAIAVSGNKDDLMEALSKVDPDWYNAHVGKEQA